MNVVWGWLLGLALLSGSAAAPDRATGAASPTPVIQPPPPAAKPTVTIVESSVMLVDCPAKLQPKQAKETITGLVEGCSSVPGGRARFVAVLEPDGAVTITAPDGSTQGTIPICVLSHKLKHKLAIKKPCKVDVQIEETAE